MDENKDALQELPDENEHSLTAQFLFWKTLFFGIPGIFRPLTPMEYMQEMAKANYSEIGNMSFAPSALFKSDFPQEFFDTLSDRIQRSSIGIICNSYNYKEAKTVVYINKAANKMLTGTRFSLKKRWGEEEFDVQLVCPDGLRACLHCVEYGSPYHDQYEGAYQYNPLIAPLKICKNIYIVAALPFSRPERELRTLLDAYCFKMKMLFHNAIFSEMSNINLINELINKKIIRDPNYHLINIELLEPSCDVHFFDYFRRLNKELFLDGIEKVNTLENTLKRNLQRDN